MVPTSIIHLLKQINASEGKLDFMLHGDFCFVIHISYPRKINNRQHKPKLHMASLNVLTWEIHSLSLKSRPVQKIHKHMVFQHQVPNKHHRCNSKKIKYGQFLQFNCIASAWYFSKSASRSSADTFSPRPAPPRPLPRPRSLRTPCPLPPGLLNAPPLPCPLSQINNTQSSLMHKKTAN